MISSPRGVLALLLSINILNYVDRQVVYALLPLIQGDLHLTDVQAGSLASAFMIIYMIAAPPIAWLADSHGRKPWIAGGVGIWSLATGAAALAGGYGTLFLSRAAVGIGEACYGAISPSFVAERFSSERRGTALAIFSLAIPVGSALGYAGGGMLGEAIGWRHSFWAVGLPGLLLSALCVFLPADPPRLRAPAMAGYRAVWSVRTFRLLTYAGAGMTFALGGFAVWMPTFFHRAWGLGVGKAGTLFGAVTVVAGLTDSLVGGWLADRLRRADPTADLVVSGWGLLIGMPFAAAAIAAPSLNASIAALFVAETLLFLNMGPMNAAIVAVIPVDKRSMAFAANIFVIHFLGDAASPALIGWGSDHFGLTRAMLLACLALGVGGWMCLRARAGFDLDAQVAAPVSAS
ncbi:MAG: MFS transporter [Elusimicrobia bacterium]|nr:MFS transporter [Elusimicrobiota bacterium]